MLTNVMKIYPPDGGWGWMVVLGVALANTFNQSIVSVYGLLFSEHLEDLGQNTSGAAFAMNLASAISNLSGLFTGPAIKTLSTRKVMFMGCMLTASGLIMCSLTTEFWQFCISFGVFVGFGLGCIFSSSFIAVNSYFYRRKGQAVGLALAGVGMGQMLMPHIVTYLLDNYCYKGTTMILAGLALHGLVGACLCQPVKWHMKTSITPSIRAVDEEKQKLLGNANETDDNHNITVNNGPTKIRKQCNREAPPSAWQHIKTSIGFKFLREPTFLSISLGMALAFTASINFSMIFPFYLQKSAMLNRSDAALCMSIMAGCDLMSRLTLPSVTDKLKISARVTFIWGAFGLVVFRTILAFTKDRQWLMIISGCYGFIRALTIVNQSLVVSEYCSQDNLPGALGLNMVIKGCFVISFGQVLGWIRDYTSSYEVILLAQNALLITVILIWTTELCWKHFSRVNQQKKQIILYCNY